MSTLSINPTFTGRCRSAQVARPVRPVQARPVQARPVAVRKAAVRPAPASVRLTRRGRVVVTVLVLGLVLAVSTLFAGRSAATREVGAETRTHTVVVSQGDTLWAIAAEVASPGGTREMVHRIERLNALSSPALVEGQELAVPVG